MLLFTQMGRCYWLKVYEIPEGTKGSKGRALQNLLNIETGDRVNAFICVKNLTKDPEFVNSHYLLFCTKRGTIKKTLLEAYSRPRTNGVIAIDLRDDDRLVGVSLTDGNSEILIANRRGRAVRFNESTVRATGRNAMGVRGMTLDEGGKDKDEVIGMIAVAHDTEESILVVSEHGYGKRSLVEDYRITNRGTKGVKTLNVTDKTVERVAFEAVTDEHDLMIINRSGITIRIHARDISVQGRATQGVRIIDLKKRGDEIASVCRVLTEEEQEETAEDTTEVLTTEEANQLPDEFVARAMDEELNN